MQEFRLDLPNLLYFVKESCHDNLHITLSELRDMTGVIEKSKLGGIPLNLTEYLKNFIRKLQVHLAMEENSIFPFLNKNPHLIEDSLILLRNEHDEIEQDLFNIREMTKNYELPIDLDKLIRSFYLKLIELDRILQNHIQIENMILFPMIQNGA